MEKFINNRKKITFVLQNYELLIFSLYYWKKYKKCETK